MPHIHTEPGQFDHTASAFIFRTDFAEPKVMLHFHRNLNAYMQFGGHIELDEHPMQTIAHELLEESGYELSQLNILQPTIRLAQMSDGSIVHPVPVVHSTHKIGSDHFHTDSTYALVTHQTPLHLPQDGESTDIQLFTRDELAQLADEKIIENVREIALFMFDHCLTEWQIVATADFL